MADLQASPLPPTHLEYLFVDSLVFRVRALDRQGCREPQREVSRPQNVHILTAWVDRVGPLKEMLEPWVSEGSVFGGSKRSRF